jgi:hypothetical protein
VVLTIDPTRGGLVQPPSFQSLFLRLYFGDTHLASATGFLVKTNIGCALVTARHNLTGRDANTGDCLSPATGGIPDRVEIFHNGPSPDVNVIKSERLLDEEGNPSWIEHPQLGPLCDVGLLPLSDTDGAVLCPYEQSSAYVDMRLGAGDRITVVGFLMGQSAGAMLAIWCTGYVASEPALDYSGQPKFLIDCRTRPGQSGSPVIAHRDGSMVKMADGGYSMMSGAVVKPFGVYTGRIHPESDIGIVWKWSVVEALMTQFDIQVSRRVQESMMKFGRDSNEFAAELKRLNLTMN